MCRRAYYILQTKVNTPGEMFLIKKNRQNLINKLGTTSILCLQIAFTYLSRGLYVL